MAGRPIDEARQQALLIGETTYRSSTSHGCGTNIRYTNGGACVFCARRKSREQREALERENKAMEAISSDVNEPWD